MQPEPRLRTLIADDEPLAVERLQILCARVPQIDLVGSAADGEAALRLTKALSPDLLLCDIAMPGLDGMSVARALEARERRPSIIFVTAFDGFAVAAFDVAAVDYLLKPVAEDKLRRAVERVLDRRRAPALPAAANDDPDRYVREFWVPHRAEVIRVEAASIDRIEAERDYMRLHIGQRSYLLHQTMEELERRLDPHRFLRIHRSAIVRRDTVRALRHDGRGNWQVELQSGEVLRIGRSYLAAAKTMMDEARA
ncbi:MAG: LytTR family DNA-binding domain-containing protein [Sphingomonadaceae bacterium]|nr:LytTR family DNA-binding domain-containing protein [Sphingomonadaceae bacterium]